MKYLAFFIIYFVASSAWAEKIILKVFHAGSLSVPFSRMEAVFEKKYPYIEIRRESSGSVRAIRKITDLHKRCDLIAVADYSLIPKMLFPEYTDYVKLFAKNELVLCYTERSRYADKINEKNWFEILEKEEVKWGFSNPNSDPCGYRTLIAIGLASVYYGRSDLTGKLIEKYTNIRCRKTKEELVFEIPEQIKIKGKKIFIRNKSVDLLGLLESGAIDYAFEYRSVSLQHNLKFVRFPDQINLSNMKFKDLYKKVKVKLSTGKTVEGKPIIYGIAVLKNSPYPKEAKLFEGFITGKEGKKILIDCNQIPIFPAKLIQRCQSNI